MKALITPGLDPEDVSCQKITIEFFPESGFEEYFLKRFVTNLRSRAPKIQVAISVNEKESMSLDVPRKKIIFNNQELLECFVEELKGMRPSWPRLTSGGIPIS